MRIHLIIEDEDGMPWAETSRQLDEEVHYDGANYSKQLMHPQEDLIYEVITKAEENINNWHDPKF